MAVSAFSVVGFCVPISGRISLAFHQREPREAFSHGFKQALNN